MGATIDGGTTPSTELRSVVDLPWLTAGVALSVVLRVRMVTTPITTDEGGYLAIARSWAHGNVLYRDVWVDRPQGLLALFRGWDWLSAGSTSSVHVMAMVFGVVLVVATSVTAGVVGGRRASGVCALLVAATSASPVIEGHTANAELLSGALAAAGLAVGAWAVASNLSTRWFVLSGVFGGLALSMKQSGFDGLVALFVWLGLAAWFGWLPRRRVAHALTGLVGGVTAVIAALAIHGALTGWSRWWYAIAGYRLAARSVTQDAQWSRLIDTAETALPLFWPLLLVLVAGGALVLVGVGRDAAPNRAVRQPGVLLVGLWVGVSLASFLLGGQFFRHYWVLLCAPLAALVGCALAPIRSDALRAVLAVALVLPGLRASVDILRMDRVSAAIASTGDGRLGGNELVAAWFDEHRSEGDTLYAMCASAAMYAAADHDPPYPYLWWDAVRQVDGALPRLREWLRSDDGPTFVVPFLPADACDPTGEVGAIVDARYAVVANLEGFKVLKRISADPSTGG